MAEPRFITGGELLLTTLYIHFKLNIHDADDVSNVFKIGDEIGGTTVQCYQDSGMLHVAASGLSGAPIATKSLVFP